MAGDDSKSSQDKNGDEATIGEKHQIQHDSATAKRMKQTTLDDTLLKDNEPDQSDADRVNEIDESETKDHDAGNGKKASDVAKEPSGSGSQDDAIKPSEELNVPSNILEKGIVYFFVRGRVDIDQPSGVEDIARTYMILRPVETDARLSEGSISDVGNARLLALPKKVLPQSGKDRFMTFVEKAGVSFKELKLQFLASSEYETKTIGTRHTPAATPVGEGVYAITSTGRESHFAYFKTLPKNLGDVQEALGLRDQGSFILSSKNPEYPGPKNAQLPDGPGYPKDVQEEFGNLRWLPSKPQHLDYVNAQVLLIGESSGIEKAVESQDGDEDKEDPKTVLENFEHDDLERMKHLAKDESSAIFADLHAHAKDYPELQTTF